MKPNLFELAPEEPYQDAFLAWLLQWASPEHAPANPELHAVATDLLIALISLQDDQAPRIVKVLAGRQWNDIDVWAEVNDSHLVIIERKANLGGADDRLVRHKAAADDWCARHRRRPIRVYLKTRGDSAQNLARARAHDFAVYDRDDMLRLLASRPVQNDICADFLARFRLGGTPEILHPEKRIGDWTNDDWKEFYRWLEPRWNGFDWFYVNKPGGGFWAGLLDYGKHRAEDAWPYLQIEKDWLCFNLGEVAEMRGQTRDRYHELLMANGGRELGLRRPVHFDHSRPMTVAVVPRGLWLGGDDEFLHPEQGLKRLRAYAAWLEGTLQICGTLEAEVGCRNRS